MVANRGEINISFVGDIFPANLPYNRNCGVASLCFDEAHRQEYVRQIRNIIGRDSFFVANLESPILPETEFSKEKQFAGHPDFIKMLKEAGIGLLTLANNHSLEHHYSGLESTIKTLQSEAIPYIGINDKDGNAKVGIIEKEGLRLAFIAYNAIDNQKNEQGYICIYDDEKIRLDVAKLKSQEIDYIFLLLHWGDEYIQRPSSDQIEQARAFIDAGANFVICSHPHVVQPIEEYHGGLICYSLGNFVFDMAIPKSARTGMVVDIKLSKDHYECHERFVTLQDNFFPVILEDDQQVRCLLKTQEQMMIHWKSEKYSKRYDEEKKRKRLQKRIAEKYLLIKNWRRYSPAIRQEYMRYYIDFFKHGKN